MVLRNSSLRAGEAASLAVTLAAKPDGLSSTLSMVKKKDPFLWGCSLTYTHFVIHSPTHRKHGIFKELVLPLQGTGVQVPEFTAACSSSRSTLYPLEHLHSLVHKYTHAHNLNHF